MDTTAKKHSDCRNFIPVDVAKGLCQREKTMVFIDEGEVCGKFETLPKCKNCSNFVEPAPDGMGTCVGLSDGEFWAQGDLTATTCEGYRSA